MVRPTQTHIFIELHVPELKSVKDFYGKLGFKKVWDTDEYLVMQLGENILGFYCGENPFFANFSPSTPRGYGVEITVQIVDDISGYFRRISPLIPSASLVSTLQAVDYGTSIKWEFRLVDPFGYYLHFTEPVNYLYK